MEKIQFLEVDSINDVFSGPHANVSGKIIGRISIDKFVFVIPFILVVLLVMIKWNSSQKQVDHIKREVDVAKRMEDSYSELLTNVRLKQHEFKIT